MELLRREFPRDGTGSMVLSPDGKLVAIWTGANTRKLYLWDWQGAGEPREVKVPRQRVDRVVFSPDGKALLACGDLEPFVYEWDVATGDLKIRSSSVTTSIPMVWPSVPMARRSR